MSKGNYTHVQELFPEIKAMLASGKTQREVAEYFGFRDKYVVKKLVKRERAKQRKQEAGIEIRPKGRPRKDAGPRDIVTEIGVWKSNIPVLFFQLFILAYLWYDNSERLGGVQAMFSHVDPTLSLEKLRTNIEGQFFDRKSARIQARDFAHHLSAFANASGGLVVIGIEDNGSVTGVTENQENSFRQAAYDFLQTIPEYETEAVLCKTHSGEQKTILLFRISPSGNEIIRLKNGEAFLRVGDQSRKLSADMLSSLGQYRTEK